MTGVPLVGDPGRAEMLRSTVTLMLPLAERISELRCSEPTSTHGESLAERRARLVESVRAARNEFVAASSWLELDSVRDRDLLASAMEMSLMLVDLSNVHNLEPSTVWQSYLQRSS